MWPSDPGILLAGSACESTCDVDIETIYKEEESLTKRNVKADQVKSYYILDSWKEMITYELTDLVCLSRMSNQSKCGFYQMQVITKL